jgi:uncharacterized membrane protein
MNEGLRTGSLLVATLAAGLIAGLFYGYACSVMPGLNRSDDRTFVVAMQRINVAIINGWFMLTFLGTPLFIAAAGALQLAGHRPAWPWTAAALAFSLLGLIVTGGVNVPLNNELEAAGQADGVADLAALRARFEARWVRWNLVRAIAYLAAFGCLTWALVLHGRAG